MSLGVINNDKPISEQHRIIIEVLFNLRRDYQITTHRVTTSFYHIKKADKIIGFACSQIMAIDKAFSFIGVLPPYLMECLINENYKALEELKEVMYG